MVNLSIKNVPEELAERLRERAERNNRSLQGELLSILEESVEPQKISLEEAHERVRSLNISTKDDSLETLRKLRNDDEGR